MKEQNYYLGLDMGTNSVGWAVTNHDYELIRAKGKDLWGVREFDEADTAVERRSHRISRRRTERNKVRIGFLKDYFADEINKVDPSFFQRLDNSKYHLEDKDENVRYKYAIFNDKNFNDRDYFKKYPTIFHLRSELIHNKEPHDVRLVYLAVLNMYKHRGHFLANGLDTSGEVRNISQAYSDLAQKVSDYCGLSFPELSSAESDNFNSILSNNKFSRSRKSSEIIDLLHISDKTGKEFVKALCGLEVGIGKMFPDIEIDDSSISKFSFSSGAYDENEAEILGIVGEDYSDVIASLKEIYNLGALSSIMNGCNYLSDARINDYNKHKDDLRKLKKVIRKYCSQNDYYSLFKSTDEGSYSAYVNSTNSKKKYRRNLKGRKVEDLYKNIKKLLKDAPATDEDVSYIKEQIDAENFLPKQLSASNGVIPNQVHEREMRVILNNAKEYLPFLSEIGESGQTIAEEIIQIFTFTIPYFVGPVSENSKKYGGNGWVVRKAPGRVMPWNINEKIDIDKTNEEFIQRMVRKCTYITDKTVLPKNSLLYERFCVLNEINNIRICGERIDVNIKQDIYKELYEKGKKITRKKLEDYLISRGLITESIQLTGIDENLNNYLASYGKFKSLFGNHIDEDKYKADAEKIIFLSTIYGDNKKYLRNRLKNEIEDLSDEQIKKILGFKFSDWSKLSSDFLLLKACDKSTGEEVSIIDALWNSQLNLMELINSDAYTFKEALSALQTSSINNIFELTHEDIDELYFSAPVKRMIWQAIRIVREITEVMGCAPEKLFVEMTRESGEKKRTITRKSKFIDLYKSIKDEQHNWKEIIEKSDENGTLRSKKMYLYLTQRGRCMYTGETINLDKLFDDNLYDIDHIYPRHFVKDDNIDNNLVLVKKEKNAHKSDNYPIEKEIFDSQIAMWNDLYEHKFINQTKYNRLISRQEFTDEQKAGFIARQLVETSQATKGVNNILKEALGDQTTIVYSKASNVSDFRHKYGFGKSRIVNEFHHANDAYLNIVVGNVYYTKFTQNPIRFVKEEYNKDRTAFNYHLTNMYNKNVERNGYVAWVASNDTNGGGTIAVVRKMMAKNTPLLTRMTYVNHSGITRKENPLSSKLAKKGVYFPQKTTDERVLDVTKYGGKKDVATAYFFLVEHTVKKNRVRTLETVPVYLTTAIEKDAKVLEKYCVEKLGLIDPDVRISKIGIQSLIKKDGYCVNISGTSEGRIILRNAVQLSCGIELYEYIHKIEKYIEKGIFDEKITHDENMNIYCWLIEKYKNSIYKYRPNIPLDTLVLGKEKMDTLSVEDQAKVLYQILLVTAVRLGASDLTLINGSKNSGMMKISNNITNCKEVKLINTSVTGIYINEIDLMTI